MANGYYLSAVIDDCLLNPQHLQTAIPNLLLIKPALLQMLYELWVIPLESSQQIARLAIVETIIDGIERCVLTSVSG